MTGRRGSFYKQYRETITDEARHLRHLSYGLQYLLDNCKLPRYTTVSTDSTELLSMDNLAGTVPEPRSGSLVLAHEVFRPNGALSLLNLEK